MAKRIIICCDGTWSTPADAIPTNVRRLSQFILPQAPDGTVQSVYCQDGVGTHWYDKWPGGAFGAGIDEKIQEGYRLICEQYAAGDQIYLLGYSRGAYTARSLGGLIDCVGLLAADQTDRIEEAYRIYRIQQDDQRKDKASNFRSRYSTESVPIALLGCWDTVGALGIPDVLPNIPIDYWVNKPLRFHNTNLSPLIQHALHVASVDEQQKIYSLTPMQVPAGSPTQLRQIWFPGDHAGMGKGALADVTLAWMIAAIGETGLGLAFDATKVATLRPDPLAGDVPNLFVTRSKGISLLTITGLRVREIPAAPTPENRAQLFHPSVQERWCKRTDYRPKCLVDQGWRSIFDAGC
jgi:Uncharacterized alpha/beta hydrolase domain (DUF2235)